MAISSTHSYHSVGLRKNINPALLKKIILESNSQKLHNRTYIHDLNHISHLSGVDSLFLYDVMMRNNKPYHSFEMKKKNGTRTIKVPNDKLKVVQRVINQEVLSKIPVHWRCFSYHKGASIVKCASEHLGAQSLIKLDISDFFGSIDEFTVYKALLKLKYSPPSSFAMARLCTHPNKSGEVSVLPQGAPTSPSLSNIIFFDIDCKLQKLASKNNLIYSRYADDITFSSFYKMDRSTFLEIKLSVVKILNYYRFSLNKKKVRFIHSGMPKFVLGINVSGTTLKLSKKYKNDIDCHIYGVIKYGLHHHSLHREFASVFCMIQHVFGKIYHAKSVDYDFGISREQEFRNYLHTQGLFF
ncbi:reverse transcriptase family protein [Aliivibrio fischeri]|uniref:reverse transcriptase family protein n=1 Tax=Aliivibrio fischeri TaxID=668 RepID=UPI0012D9DDE8|nr:reverse transcriptase family protein [Aliivibrio fischeri]MUJ21357.1 hypothetical protein [Aliivibrio fischeri]